MVGRRFLLRLVVLLAVLLPFAWCFGPLMTGERLLAYRDTITFYYPAYTWAARVWSGGRIPLWNDQTNIGGPVVAETTSAIFYPGKLVFTLPLSEPLRFNLYVVGHVLFAVVAAFLLARKWTLSICAAGLCGISYAFGGVVLFQHCNVIFLVGAAWLPAALLAIDRMLVTRRWQWAVSLGAVLALMTLGGDPQMAYHAAVLATLFALLPALARLTACVRASLPGGRESAGRSAWSVSLPSDPPHDFRGFTHRPIALLTIAAVSCALLTAVQVVPSISWAKECQRALFETPRNIYEIPEYVARMSRDSEDGSGISEAAGPNHVAVSVTQGIFGEPVPGTHHQHLYNFSFEPWRCVELIWPNVTGRMLPENQRWLTAISAEGRVWTPSIFLGVAPLLLVFANWRLSRRNRCDAESARLQNRDSVRRVRWLTWMVVFGLVGSFGWYGLGWLVKEVYRHCGADPSRVGIGSPVGGVYWAMVTSLPGYVYFRYPAKLLVVFSLGMSMLAGYGFDRIRTTNGQFFRTSLVIVGFMSMVIGLVIVVVQPFDRFPQSVVHSNELFGPFLTDKAHWGVVIACFHTAVVCGLLWWLFRWRAMSSAIRSCGVLIITALELTVANGCLVPTIPVDSLETRSVCDRSIAGEGAWEERVATGEMSGAEWRTKRVKRFYRLAQRRWVPETWTATSSSERLSEVVAWDSQTLYPNFHLLGGHSNLATQQSVAQRDYRAVLEMGSGRSPNQVVLNLLGAELVLLPPNVGIKGKASGDAIITSRSENLRVWHNRTAYNRAWIVHDVQSIPAINTNDPAKILRRTNEVLCPEGCWRDFSRTAVVESASEIRPPSPDPGVESGVESYGEESCEITSADLDEVVLEATLKKPGLVVLSDQYHPDWIVEVTTDDQPVKQYDIMRTNRTMRGVYLNAGRHKLVFRFTPHRFYVALVISGMAWCVFGVGVFFRYRISSKSCSF